MFQVRIWFEYIKGRIMYICSGLHIRSISIFFFFIFFYFEKDPSQIEMNKAHKDHLSLTWKKGGRTRIREVSLHFRGLADSSFRKRCWVRSFSSHKLKWLLLQPSD